MSQNIFDTFIIGGGINGVGLAADLSGRGLSVCLVEKNDLASATSQSSSKLIHGGLRYLEHFEFRLVKESLRERRVLLQNAPHLVKPLRFVMPYHRQLRPAWLIRLGLFLYDFLDGSDTLPRCKSIQFQEDGLNPLNHTYKKGFEYYDCKVDDARLVVSVAKTAENKGAKILPRTRFVRAAREGDVWHIHVEHEDKHIESLYARSIVNVAGPWVEQVESEGFNIKAKGAVRLIKGSHIVVPKLYDGDHAYILQHRDGRVIFVIPFERNYNLIGTTDEPYEGDPALVAISEDEVLYLCNAVNAYFKQAISPDAVAWAYAGVRPLKNDGQSAAAKVTRDYSFELSDHHGKAPLLTVIGGKLTTYRKLAESACDKLRPYFPQMGKPWTASAPLAGGELKSVSCAEYMQKITAKFPWLPEALRSRYLNHYGNNIEVLLQNCQKIEDLGEAFGAGLYQKEIEYLVKHEWARTADDILWRRTKLGLHLPQAARRRVADYLTGQST